MDEFIYSVFRREESIDRVIKRFTLPEAQLQVFKSFSDVDLGDYAISTLNRWSIGIDAVRAETAFSRHEQQYGDDFFSRFFPLANIMYYHRIAVACKNGNLEEAIRWTTGLNAFGAIVSNRLSGEARAYLGRASIALESYGLTLTAHLPQLGLKLQSY